MKGLHSGSSSGGVDLKKGGVGFRSLETEVVLELGTYALQ